MPFYTRHPLDTLLLSDPFFTSFLSPGHHNTPAARSEEHASVRAFSPNFDIHETPKEYVLEGELPGLEDKKKNLSIEFTDANTLVIRGKIERSFQSSTPSAGAIEGTSMKGAITEGGEQGAKEGAQKEANGGTEKKKQENDDGIKYWVSERTVGSFQRSFSFPGEIDQDNVKASLEHGILKVIVPKKEKKATKKIVIA